MTAEERMALTVAAATEAETRSRVRAAQAAIKVAQAAARLADAQVANAKRRAELLGGLLIAQASTNADCGRVLAMLVDHARAGRSGKILEGWAAPAAATTPPTVNGVPGGAADAPPVLATSVVSGQPDLLPLMDSAA